MTKINASTGQVIQKNYSDAQATHNLDPIEPKGPDDFINNIDKADMEEVEMRVDDDEEKKDDESPQNEEVLHIEEDTEEV